MQINPMQRKSRNSFLLGMLVTLLITGVVIVLLFLQLKKIKDEEIKEANLLTKVYTINQDVKSGQILTKDMLELQTISKTMVPDNATGIEEEMNAWFLRTKEGEQIYTYPDYPDYSEENSNVGLYIEKPDNIIEVYSKKDEEGNYIYNENMEKVDFEISSDLVLDDEGAFIVDKKNEDAITKVYKEKETDNYYIYEIDTQSMSINGNKNRVKKYIEIDNVPLVAKIEMMANTVITPELVAQSNEVITDDMRIQEYNMITLPMDLMSNEYIDIRFMAPNGQDFIVVSKVSVEVPMNEDGSYVADTIRMKLSEDEILLMSSAIVEAYGLTGSKIYATKYVEAGTQDEATVTYVPNKAVSELINADPNIVDTAMKALKSRYTQDLVSVRNNYLQSAIDKDQNYTTNVQTKMTEATTNMNQARKNYLQSLTSGTDEEYEEDYEEE